MGTTLIASDPLHWQAFASIERLDRRQLAAAPLRWPRPSRLQAELDVRPGKMADGLRTLGLGTVGDLLLHLPREHSPPRTIASLTPGDRATLTVEVRSIAARPTRNRRVRLVEAVLGDETGSMRATFFNQPWLVRRYGPGQRLIVEGTAEPAGRFRVSTHALASERRAACASGSAAAIAVAELDVGDGETAGEPARAGAGGPGQSEGAGGPGQSEGAGEPGQSEGAGEPGQSGGAGEPGQSEGVARYPATEGLSSTQIVALMQSVRPALADVPEALPACLRAREGLPERAAALSALHFPARPQEAEQGRRRLAFEELLELELLLLRRRAVRERSVRAEPIGPRGSLAAGWLEDSLPFAPTPDQWAAIATIDEDLSRTSPMQRLLMGEVGSGKTIVALYAMLRAVEQGMQGVLMAPTETLAEQHFQTLQGLLPDAFVSSELLTGSLSARRRADVLARIATGQCRLVVGTHALIEPDVLFDRLSVAVVDEQHRFGVRQRAALDAKGPQVQGGRLAPHVLHMTATPIPRTLALTTYGDLDVTELRGLPGGRKPVSTHVASTDAERERAYERIREELAAGRQAFVVCPLVEESELLQARAATAEFERLARTELRDFRVVLMHGQMPARERQTAMKAFAGGAADVLVATTVVEVGVDVPNATVMLVEDAERYGISQLHQLRGRIGRGEHPSLCLLFGPRHSRRLRALAEHRDGFRLAEIDLQLRDQGDLAGVRQSGARELRIASLPEDADLLESARRWAGLLLQRDPELRLPEHALLGGDARLADRALEPIPA